jgi:glucose-6-phosphate dehydrogenase assembly protein OpcA
MDSIKDEEKRARLSTVKGDKPLIYASLFNLIIYTIDKAKNAYLEEIAQTVIKKYPCRIIFIQGCSDKDKDYIHTAVTTAVLSDHENTIACDQINIEASQKQFHRIPFLILPNIVPDLPIYLLWGQDPTGEHDILPSLQRYASRLIFDSDSTFNLQASSKKMIEMIESEKLEVCDINWIALKNWREAIARIFNTEEKIRQLRLTKTIDIQFNSTQSPEVLHPEIQAMYLQGWIAAQMEWGFRSIASDEAGKQITYANGGLLTAITLTPSEWKNQAPGSVYRVEIVDHEGNSILIDRKDHPSIATIHVTTQDRCEMPCSLPLSDQRKGIAFVQELFYRQTGCHYKNMLSIIAQYGFP